MNKRQTGAQYERVAAAYLEKQGYRILERNFRCRQGEIDLIALDGAYLVFIEVKFRKDSSMGVGSEAVDGKKQKRISESAEYYLYCHPGYSQMPCRFDVVTICGEEISLLQDAFWSCL